MLSLIKSCSLIQSANSKREIYKDKKTRSLPFITCQALSTVLYLWPTLWQVACDIIVITGYNVTYSPPKSCIPSKAKMRMKRKSRKSRDTMERILLSNDITRLRNDAQYLKQWKNPECHQLIYVVMTSEQTLVFSLNNVYMRWATVMVTTVIMTTHIISIVQWIKNAYIC